MNKLTKLLSLAVAICIVSFSFAACGGKEVAQTTDGKSFSLWTVMDANSSQTLSNYNEMLMYQELEKRTGVHIDFIHPIAGSTGSEAFMTMLSGSTMPDIVEYNWNSYTGGPDQAIEDGVIVALNDYLEEYAPNFYNYMEGEKGKANDNLYRLQSMTEKGNYYGFTSLRVGHYRSYAGILVRADKLREWNMSIPETIDDWTALFAKAKSEGFDEPFTSGNEIFSFGLPWPSNCFNSGFDVGKDFYVEGDKIVFAPFQPGYKEFVAQMAEWVKNGYVDTSFVTNDSATLEGKMVNGTSIATYYTISSMEAMTTSARQIDPNFELVACPNPVPEKGDALEFHDMSGEVGVPAFAITNDCGNVTEVIKWCDYIYSEEGAELHAFGIEGDTYTVTEADGEKHYVYTDKVINYDENDFSSVAASIFSYALPAGSPGLSDHPDYLNSMYTLDSQKEALEMWNKDTATARKHLLPTLTYTEEESREKTDILEIAQDTLEVALTNIILGKASIDTYDDAIKEAKANGYDRLLEINQAAYDRYMSKLDK